MNIILLPINYHVPEYRIEELKNMIGNKSGIRNQIQILEIALRSKVPFPILLTLILIICKVVLALLANYNEHLAMKWRKGAFSFVVCGEQHTEL